MNVLARTMLMTLVRPGQLNQLMYVLEPWLSVVTGEEEGIWSIYVVCWGELELHFFSSS